MNPQRSILRACQGVSQQLRTPVIRSNLQRRFASSEGPALTGPADNAFNRERQAVKAHAAATSGKHHLVNTLKMCVTIPCLIIAGVNAYNLWTEHWEHWAHEPPLEERVEYPYQNIRTKNYFWGNGDEVSFLGPFALVEREHADGDLIADLVVSILSFTDEVKVDNGDNMNRQ
ncbi:Cytochrome c oxidase subunit 6A, mitochondrial [Lignoscripta atroalba]|nr:Cytochrome c oxidase subunit 6A, mitochondrial [Lignoscripta atroalba]